MSIVRWQKSRENKIICSCWNQSRRPLPYRTTPSTYSAQTVKIKWFKFVKAHGKSCQPVSNTRERSARGHLWLVYNDHVMDVDWFDWLKQCEAVKTHHVDTAALKLLREFVLNQVWGIYFNRYYQTSLLYIQYYALTDLQS